MAVRFIITGRKNNIKPAEPEKFYLLQKSVGSVDRDYLIEDMVRNTTLTKSEAASGIDYLFEAIPRLLGMGFTVKLGKLGYFMISIKSEGVNRREDAGIHQLRELHLRFVPGKNLKEELDKMSLERHPDNE